ncbi:MAG TPA: RsmG family class I SAM-dependent methyltransferase [Pyrinomonadaceae bacterium]|nr:RsmG family class I SAM-dependent methyltransferase [Pyrinomonadaceae bacterium]
MDFNRTTTAFRKTLATESSAYGVTLSDSSLNGLAGYYELLQRWNPRVHLVAPCTPEQFATRHVLESLIMLKYLPNGASVAEVGSGAGLPILPCLIVRPDITAVMFEISQKKAVFLREALGHTGLSARAVVKNDRFEDTEVPAAQFLTCRALDRFEEMLQHLLEWAPRPSTSLLFGAQRLAKKIESLGFESSAELIPNSKARFLYVVKKG